MGQPERLVVHEELNRLGIGYVADRLTGFGKTISIFAIDDRMGFIEAIDKGAIFGNGTTLLGATAHAEIPVPQRHDGFHLGEELWMKALLDDVPFIGRVIVRRRPETLMPDHSAPLAFVSNPISASNDPSPSNFGCVATILPEPSSGLLEWP